MTLPPGIDADRFRARCLGDAGLMAELMALFGRHAPPEAARLRAAVDAGDAETARAAAHKLKSAAGTVAAETLYALLVEADRDPTPDRVEAVEGELRRCLDESVRT